MSITNQIHSDSSIHGLIALVLSLVLLAGSLVGCSAFETSDSESEVRFSTLRTGYVAANDLRVSFSEGKQTQTISGEDFEPVSFDASSYWTRPFATASTGTLSVSFEITTDEGQKAAEGTLKIELKEEWQWTVSFRADSASYNPLRECLGCQGYHSFQIDTTVVSSGPTRPDSVYVVLGGGPPDEKVDY